MHLRIIEGRALIYDASIIAARVFRLGVKYRF